MKSFDAVTKIAESPSSVVWEKNIGTAVFAALILACSITAGCSSDKPKPTNSVSQIPMTPPHIEEASQAKSVEVAKTAPKKVVKKRSAVRTYKDKTYGVSFVYPRKYGVEVGDAANELIAGSPAPLTSAQPGGVALAAVELPETAFPKTDFASAFFGVSVNKALTAERCGFAENNSATENQSEQKIEVKAASASDDAKAGSSAFSTAVVATSTETASTSTASPAIAQATESSSTKASPTESSAVVEADKLKIGDAELLAKESVAGEGARQDDAKYYRTFQNGACYEFALNVTTVAKEEVGMKHVDRDKVFNRLEKILATVKIDAAKTSPAATAEVPAAEKPGNATAAAAVPETPAQ